MRLVSFENSVGQGRIGAVTPDGRIVDLNSACVLYLRDVEGAEACARLSDAIVPADMRGLFEGGENSERKQSTASRDERNLPWSLPRGPHSRLG
jgi:hypothetical protein